MRVCARHIALYVGALVATAAYVHAEPASRTNFFPIMAWNWVPDKPALLTKMREAGLTVAGFVAPKTLRACKAVGIRAIVSDPRASNYDWNNLDEAYARRKIKSLVADVGTNPAVYGYFLRDEPSANLFPGLAKVTSLITILSPGKIPYVNLLPNYATPRQLGANTYRTYLKKYIHICHPPLICYDNYSIMDSGSIRRCFWSNLEAVRAICLHNGLPFWTILLSVAHFNYRVPTAAALRLEVFASLAYGARGIVYFTYFAPKRGNYRMAPIDQFGHETPTWFYMQNVNLQVQELAPTLLTLTSDDVYYLGHIPDDCHGPTKKSLIKSVGAGNFLVGDFTGADASHYALVVNRDLHQSHCCHPQVGQQHTLKMVSPYTGQLVPFTGEQVWLAPGGGVLLKFN